MCMCVPNYRKNGIESNEIRVPSTNHPNVLAKSDPVPKGMSCTKIQ